MRACFPGCDARPEESWPRWDGWACVGAACPWLCPFGWVSSGTSLWSSGERLSRCWPTPYCSIYCCIQPYSAATWWSVYPDQNDYSVLIKWFVNCWKCWILLFIVAGNSFIHAYYSCLVITSKKIYGFPFYFFHTLQFAEQKCWGNSGTEIVED